MKNFNFKVSFESLATGDNLAKTVVAVDETEHNIYDICTWHKFFEEVLTDKMQTPIYSYWEEDFIPQFYKDGDKFGWNIIAVLEEQSTEEQLEAYFIKTIIEKL